MKQCYPKSKKKYPALIQYEHTLPTLETFFKIWSNVGNQEEKVGHWAVYDTIHKVSLNFSVLSKKSKKHYMFHLTSVS